MYERNCPDQLPPCSDPVLDAGAKNGLLRLLKRCYTQYLVEQMMETRGQQSLTTFGFTARHAAEDGRDRDDRSTSDEVT